VEESPREETGLVLWGGVELDVTVQSLQKKTCACGSPATVAVRRLDEQTRTFACASCALRTLTG
jgi:hypothetical protein